MKDLNIEKYKILLRENKDFLNKSIHIYCVSESEDSVLLRGQFFPNWSLESEKS